MIINSKKPVLIIDFGSQYTKIIAKKIRELNIYCELISSKNNDLLNLAKESGAIILSGGPKSVNNSDFLDVNDEIFNLNIPILGICYGMQLIHKKLGGKIESQNFSEYGHEKLEILEKHPLVMDIPKISQIWASHNDSVVKLADGFKLLAKTRTCMSITANDEKKIYTTLFHPEIDITECGFQLIKNFLFLISGLSQNWEKNEVLLQKQKEIYQTVQSDNVLLALSGGVDSSVLCFLLNSTIKNSQIFPVFVDNGLLRTGTAQKIINFFKEKFVNFHYIDASERFLSELKDVEEPEKKREIIGKLFIQIFNEYVEVLKQNHAIKFLAQGTIYSDVIESGEKSDNSKKIKSHHNVLGWKEKHNFKILEPLADLFKNEVKEFGYKLLVPEWIMKQQPFPGPGLSIRTVGKVTKEKINLLRSVDSMFLNEMEARNLKNLYSQAFAVLLPIKSVGVKGDERTYEYTIVLRAIYSEDFMTASCSEIPIKELIDISRKISNCIPGVGRVLYDITSKPPATIEWE